MFKTSDLVLNMCTIFDLYDCPVTFEIELMWPTLNRMNSVVLPLLLATVRKCWW